MDVQDQRFRIERSTAASIPAEARHGTPRELFTFWLTTSTSFSAIVVGGLAVDLGLDFWQSIVCIALGAASFVVLGAVSSLGPRFGLPTMGVGERVFGRGANKVNAFIAWLLTLGWGSVGLVIGAESVQSIIGYYAPGAPADATKAAGLIVMAVLGFAASLFGNATLKSIESWLGYVFAVIVVAVCIALGVHGSFAHLSFGHDGSLADFSVAAVVMMSSGGLSWCYMGAEYSRYLPASASRSAVGWLTTAGGAIPALLLPVLGVVLTISGHFSDPITDIPKVVTAWIGVPFLAFAVVSIGAANVPNLYSAGLNLLVLGVPVRRSASIAIAFCVSLAGALYALFVSNFISTFETFLSLSVVWVVPWVAVLLVSLLFRRNADNADSTPGARWQACAAGLAGMAVAFLCNNDAPRWTGPIARALGGGDISVYASAFVALLAFAVLRAWRRQPAAAEPTDVAV
jgi:nucleobase:cation symporter-1, NCS1 family